jgi:tRNA-specific adenosine deaminase 2
MNATNRTYNGTRHAEFMAIAAMLSPAGANAVSDAGEARGRGGEGREGGERETQTGFPPEMLRECDLYVTVEPCIMCASLLRQFGVRKVYYGASNEKFGGTGGVLNVQKANGREGGSEEEGDYEVSGGWLREEAIVMLRRFYVQENGRGEFWPCGERLFLLFLLIALCSSGAEE